MATVTFNQEKKDNDKEQVIFLLFRYNNQRVKLSTKLKCFPKDFDSRRYKIKANAYPINKDYINNRLEDIERTVTDGYKYFVSEYEREPQSKELKTLFDRLLFKNEEIIKRKLNIRFHA